MRQLWAAAKRAIPPPPHSQPHPPPHLVSDEHYAVFVRQLPQGLHEARRGGQEAALTQHRLKDDGSNIRGVDLTGTGEGGG